MKYKNVKDKRNLRRWKDGGTIRQEKSLSNRMKVNKFKSDKESKINTKDHKNKQKKKGSKLFNENNVIIIKKINNSKRGKAKNNRKFIGIERKSKI